MNIIPVIFLLLAMIKSTISYRDYPAPRMPAYDIDYDMRESRTRPDYSTPKMLHTDDDDDDDKDYKYDDEGDSSKPLKEFYGDDTVLNKHKILSPKDIKEDIDTELYHEKELKQRNRRRKTFGRKNAEFDSEEDDRKMEYSRNSNIDNDVDEESHPLKEDNYKESDEKETNRYFMREFVNRKTRRKPRDRPIKVILPNNEHVQSNNEKNVRQKMRKDTLQERSGKEDIAKKILIESFDDMKRVNNFKENLPLIIRQPVNMTELASSEVLPHRRADKIDDAISISLKVPNTTLNLPYNMTLKMEAANKSELSLAERSRLSILKKVQKKENSNVTKTTKPPILMQVTNNMQTVVLVESNNLENEIMKVRRVMDDNPEVIERAKHLMRQKLVANAKSIEDLTEEATTAVAMIAELSELLGHRQRKDIAVQKPRLPSTFSPHAVDPQMENEWNNFIKTNQASPLDMSLYVVLLLINYLIYFN